MKNLLIYISPEKNFTGDAITLVKVQIDNSLDLGWKKEDIVLVTNFDYEYNGVKSIVVGDENYCAVRPRSINTIIIPHLVDMGIVAEGNIYWDHDFDAYQMNLFDEKELNLEGVDAGLTDYGWKEQWCMGSFFIKNSSKDIFQRVKEIVEKNIEDETAMMQLTDDDVDSINHRIKRMNITYNFGMRQVGSNYEKAIKPLRVVHFHPYYPYYPTLDVFMHGKNELNMPLIDKRLIKIFNHHGIK